MQKLLVVDHFMRYFLKSFLYCFWSHCLLFVPMEKNNLVFVWTPTCALFTKGE